MKRKLKHYNKVDGIDAKIFIVRDFIDEFYNKTLFRNGRPLDTDLPASFIKSLFAFTNEEKVYPIGELGKNVRVKRSTITDIVDRLERDGIAERLRDNRDRRIVKVRLTERGKNIRRAFIEKRRRELRAIFSRLEKEETKKLLYHLDEASKILKKIK